jgi:hypothetical protein
MQTATARALLDGVVDYAGLFPPAALPMVAAVAEYAAAMDGPDAWMLGRFVLPAARLSEFAEVRAAVAVSARPWRLSAIVADGSEADQAAIAAFNADSARHRAVVDSAECRPLTPDGIEWLSEAFGGVLEVYVEVAPGSDAARWLERVKAHGLKGKVRTGGLTAAAFPEPTALLSFIEAALGAGVPFKATAGLHHAVRGSYRLTYEPGAAEASMYGYLNVLLATAALRAGLPLEVAAELLRQSDSSTLVFADDRVCWGDAELPAAALRDTRADHLESFGSCSFREPVEELHSLIPDS